MCQRRLVQYLLVCARLGQEGEQIHRYSHTHMHTNNTRGFKTCQSSCEMETDLQKPALFIQSYLSLPPRNQKTLRNTLQRWLESCPKTNNHIIQACSLLSFLNRHSLPHLSLHPILYARPIITAAYQNSGFFCCFYFNGFNLLVIIKAYILLMLLNVPP